MSYKLKTKWRPSLNHSLCLFLKPGDINFIITVSLLHIYCKEIIENVLLPCVACHDSIISTFKIIKNEKIQFLPLIPETMWRDTCYVTTASPGYSTLSGCHQIVCSPPLYYTTPITFNYTLSWHAKLHTDFNNNVTSCWTHVYIDAKMEMT